MDVGGHRRRTRHQPRRHGRGLGRGRERLPALVRGLRHRGVRRDPEIIPFLEDGPNYEAIKELKPDLILSLYSGVSDIEYERLTEIALTVPYIEGPWNPGTWEDMTRTVGKALSEEDKADELIAETEEQITTRRRAPRVRGQDVRVGSDLNEGGTDLGVYLEYDPRVRITEALGFTSTSAMDSFLKTAEGDNWYTGVSLENLYDVEADLFAAWAAAPTRGPTRSRTR